MDPVQAANEARQREQVSAKLADRAKTDPRGTTTGGGFRSNAPGSGTDKAADSPGKYDGGLSGGVIHTADQTENLRQKASHGITITNDDLGYMGHFANDDVMRRGHNSGMKKVGKAAVTAHAKRGYRKLPGSASPVQGHAKYGEADMGLAPSRASKQKMARDKSLMSAFPLPSIASSGAAPKGVSDIKMSMKHHKESLANDLRHMADHKRSADRHMSAIKSKRHQLRK